MKWRVGGSHRDKKKKPIRYEVEASDGMEAIHKVMADHPGFVAHMAGPVEEEK